MPIYEYQCQACGKHFEEMQKISEEPLKVCPNCGKPDLKKLVSHTSFQLKGGGYYATDYKKPTQPEKESEKPKENEKKDTVTDTTKENKTPKTSEKKSE